MTSYDPRYRTAPFGHAPVFLSKVIHKDGSQHEIIDRPYNGAGGQPGYRECMAALGALGVEPTRAHELLCRIPVGRKASDWMVEVQSLFPEEFPQMPPHPYDVPADFKVDGPFIWVDPSPRGRIPKMRDLEQAARATGCAEITDDGPRSQMTRMERLLTAWAVALFILALWAVFGAILYRVLV